MEDSREKNQLLRELYQIKKDIIKFKNELNGLARQMDGMEVDLVSCKALIQFDQRLMYSIECIKKQSS
jgi:hypothetical protein